MLARLVSAVQGLVLAVGLVPAAAVAHLLGTRARGHRVRLDRAVGGPGAPILRASGRVPDRSCDVHCPGRVCRVVTPNGQIMYRDHQHVTATYARSLAPLLRRRLEATGVVFGRVAGLRSPGAAAGARVGWLAVGPASHGRDL